MTEDGKRRVRLSASNWIAIAGIVLAQLGVVWGFTIRLEGRLTKIEARQASTAEQLNYLRDRLGG